MNKVAKRERVDKINYYLDIAETVLERCTCLRRLFGAVIVKNDEIISTGYAGAPRGRANCIDLGYCARAKLNIPRGERYEMCRSVHAEQNAIISAARKDLIDSTLYLVGKEAETGEYVENAMPCILCKRFIINAGIEKVIIRNDKQNYTIVDVQNWIENDESLDGKFGY
ncbi:MAG: cytidine deaminase [Mollicutes bacterium]|jgi:dCMP deaminase|nr:cytidine deaminase [Mollicutes bacterium]